MSEALPRNVEAERSVLGSLLVSEPALGRVIEGVGLQPEDFYEDRNKHFYAAILAVNESGKPCDELTVPDALETSGTIDKAGGPGYASELAANVPDPGNVEHYAEMVKQGSNRRRIIKAAQKTISVATSGDLNGEVDQLIDALGHTEGNASTGSLQFVKGSDIPMRRVGFLDSAGMFPMSSLTVGVGGAGLGKTTFFLGVCSAATRGKLEGLDGPRNVLISSQEDDGPAVLLPRLAAAGADLTRVQIVKGLTIPAQVGKLARRAKADNAAVVLVDPIGAHLDGNVDSHKDAAIRGAIAPLADMAADLRLAVIVVAHPNKAQGQSGLSRISGSSGLGNAARSVIVFGADPADPDGDAGNRRIIAHLKNNVGKRAPSLTAEIETTQVQTEDGPATVPRIRITGTSTQCADDILSSPTPEERTDREEARDFLRDLLANGPVRSKEIEKNHAPSAGLTYRTVRRAKDDLGIKAEQKGDGWYWSLPEVAK